MRRPASFAALAGAALAVLTTVAVVPAAAAPAAKADILVDAATGRVLTGNSIHLAMPPASTAKIMTALVAAERLPPDATLTVDARAAAVESEKIGFAAGTRWPLNEMLSALMMVSANDAAYTIASNVGAGSLDTFAADLNATARRLGMHDSTLGDPAGLDDTTSYKNGALMSAYDLAVATRNALTVPAIAQWAGLHAFSFVDPQGTRHQFTNHNRMLPGGAFAYVGLTGFKTGYTQRAGHTLVATATRNGRTLIAVILGASDSGYSQAASLLDSGFAMPPNAAGTGENLPATGVSSYSARAADLVAFASLGNGVAAGTGTGTTPAANSQTPLPLLNQPARAAAPRAAATAKTRHQSGGLFRVRNLVLVIVVLLVITFFLRRRAVKRQRARRLARQRQRAAAMRSGGLPVVDGRYRPGLRVGPPVESHIHVQRVDANR